MPNFAKVEGVKSVSRQRRRGGNREQDMVASERRTPRQKTTSTIGAELPSNYCKRGSVAWEHHGEPSVPIHPCRVARQKEHSGRVALDNRRTGDFLSRCERGEIEDWKLLLYTLYPRPARRE